MKRMICLLISVICLLWLPGCQKDDSSNSLRFYYPRLNYGYDAQEEQFFEQSALLEIRTDISYFSARQVLIEYLKGPVDSALVNPFPADLTVISLNIDDETLHLTLSDQLADLNGIPLTMACACLAKTGMELTHTTSVQIMCQSALLDGEETITLSIDTFIFDDSAALVEQP